MACIAADKKITGLNPLLLLNSKVGIPLRKKIELSKMARISDGLYLLLEALRWMRCDSWRIKASQIPSIKPLEEGNSKVLLFFIMSLAKKLNENFFC